MADRATSSGLKTSDGVIYNDACSIKSVVVTADGTNAATAILYDNASAASGTVLVKVIVDAGLTYEMFHSDGGVIANNGVYLDIGGTGAECVVHFVAGG